MDGNNTALILDLDPPLPLSRGVTTVRSSSCNEGTSHNLREAARAPGPASPPQAARAARYGGPRCGEVRPAASEGRRRGGPASPRDWRPAAPPGPDRQAGSVARGLAAGTSRAWSASACSRVLAPRARAGTAAPQAAEELPSEGDAGPERVPASAVGSLLFPNSEREPVSPSSSRLPQSAGRRS